MANTASRCLKKAEMDTTPKKCESGPRVVLPDSVEPLADSLLSLRSFKKNGSKGRTELHLSGPTVNLTCTRQEAAAANQLPWCSLLDNERGTGDREVAV